MANDELDLESDEAQVLDPNIRQELRQGRKDRAALEAQIAAAQREAAFARAGIDDTTPLGSMFVKGYDGAPSVEAIKAAAEEIPGLLTPPPPAQGAMSEDELEAQRRMAGSSGGNGQGGPDLREQFAADLEEIGRKYPTKDAFLRGGADEVMALIRDADPSLGIVQKGIQG